MSYLKARKNAFIYAFQGLREAYQKETHFKLFVIIALTVCLLGIYLKVKRTDWLFILLNISFVLSLELFNSAIEKLCDVYTTEKHAAIKYIKDVMAAAVFIACLFAALSAVFIFKNYF